MKTTWRDKNSMTTHNKIKTTKETQQDKNMQRWRLGCGEKVKFSQLCTETAGRDVLQGATHKYLYPSIECTHLVSSEIRYCDKEPVYKV